MTQFLFLLNCPSFIEDWLTGKINNCIKGIQIFEGGKCDRPPNVSLLPGDRAGVACRMPRAQHRRHTVATSTVRTMPSAKGKRAESAVQRQERVSL